MSQKFALERQVLSLIARNPSITNAKIAFSLQKQRSKIREITDRAIDSGAILGYRIVTNDRKRGKSIFALNPQLTLARIEEILDTEDLQQLNKSDRLTLRLVLYYQLKSYHPILKLFTTYYSPEDSLSHEEIDSKVRWYIPSDKLFRYLNALVDKWQILVLENGKYYLNEFFPIESCQEILGQSSQEIETRRFIRYQKALDLKIEPLSCWQYLSRDKIYQIKAIEWQSKLELEDGFLRLSNLLDDKDIIFRGWQEFNGLLKEEKPDFIKVTTLPNCSTE